MPEALDYFQVHEPPCHYCDAVERGYSAKLNTLFAHGDIITGIGLSAYLLQPLSNFTE